jgi:hypothetical protein
MFRVALPVSDRVRSLLRGLEPIAIQQTTTAAMDVTSRVLVGVCTGSDAAVGTRNVPAAGRFAAPTRALTRSGFRNPVLAPHTNNHRALCCIQQLKERRCWPYGSWQLDPAPAVQAKQSGQ